MNRFIKTAVIALIFFGIGAVVAESNLYTFTLRADQVLTDYIGGNATADKVNVTGLIIQAGQVSGYYNSSQTYNKTEVDSQVVPSGAILMWSGTLATIPSSWALCDGTNGTPDLRDKFVYSVSAGENPGVTGGANNYTLSTDQLPSHQHNFTTNNTGAHQHFLNTGGWGAQGSPWNQIITPAGTFTYKTEPEGNHTHNGTTDTTGSGSSIDNRPAYYKLAFIMKL